MLTIRLSPEIERRLDALATATGRTKTFYARKAIEEALDEMEDIYLAENRMEELRAGRSRRYTLEEVEKYLGSGTGVRSIGSTRPGSVGEG